LEYSAQDATVPLQEMRMKPSCYMRLPADTKAIEKCITQNVVTGGLVSARRELN